MEVKVNSLFFSGKIAESKEFKEFHSQAFDSHMTGLFEQLEDGSISKIEILRQDKLPNKRSKP